MRHEPTNAEWRVIEPMFADESRGVARADDRRRAGPKKQLPGASGKAASA